MKQPKQRKKQSSKTAAKSSHQRKMTSTNIEKLTVQQLMDWKADVWMMSPPCQPHTRQHDTLLDDTQDDRSSSFYHLCKLLSLENPDDNRHTTSASSSAALASPQSLPASALPSLILLENVIGFEQSRSFRTYCHTLTQRQYRLAHFHLQPTQVGLPNDRPRHYTVAILQGRIRPPKPQTLNTLPVDRINEKLLRYFTSGSNENGNSSIRNEKSSLTTIHHALPELGISPLEPDNETASLLPPISVFLDENNVNNYDDDNHSANTPALTQSDLEIPPSLWERNAAWCFDIVSPTSRRSACFTSGYGRFVRGTGSILYTGSVVGHAGGVTSTSTNDQKDTTATPATFLTLLPPEERVFSPDWAQGIQRTDVRYFSGMELARLFGFSKSFQFPTSSPHQQISLDSGTGRNHHLSEGVTMKQQWKLMGNSINVRVAARLVELGLQLVSLEDAD